MIIDCDTHFMPKDAFDYVSGALTGLRPILKFSDQGLLSDIKFPGEPARVPGTTPLPPPGSGAHYPGNSDMEVRLKDYERLGIDCQFILPQFTGWWSYLIEPSLADALARSWNLSMLRLMRDYPKRVCGVALVALQDVQGAIREMEWAHENGFPAVALDHTYPVREHPYGETLGSHRELWPFFERAEKLDMPIFLHAVQHGHRIVNLLLFQHDGLDIFAPREAQMNLVSLITSGLLDDFPKLKFIHAEMGTKTIKSLTQRMDANFKQVTVSYEDDEATASGSRRRLGPKAPQLVPAHVANEKNKLPPSYYFKNNFYWTIETEEPELAEAINYLGAEHFLFATDYPHDDPGGRMKFNDVELLKANPDISESDKELIRWENASGLFKLS
ncbi:MAG: amidohydrolase family protein [Candidatus Binatia bacterium]